MLTSHPVGWSCTRLTVRLAPSMVIEPLVARNRASSRGASTHSSQLSPTSAKRVTVPTPSTWPATMWPPSRSCARSAFSRFTGPVWSRPAVLSSDSAETSNPSNDCCASIAVTVMQAPLRAMLSPRPTSSIYPAGHCTDRCLPCVEELPRACTAAMRPTPVMIPVNMPPLCWTLRSVAPGCHSRRATLVVIPDLLRLPRTTIRGDPWIAGVATPDSFHGRHLSRSAKSRPALLPAPRCAGRAPASWPT